MADTNTVRQEVELRIRAYADHILSSLAGAHGTLHGNVPEDEEIIYGIALELALAERQKVWEKVERMAAGSNGDTEWLVKAIRSQAATERGEGKVKV